MPAVGERVLHRCRVHTRGHPYLHRKTEDFEDKGRSMAILEEIFPHQILGIIHDNQDSFEILFTLNPLNDTSKHLAGREEVHDVVPRAEEPVRA